MKRIELIYSEAIQEDILSALQNIPAALFHTIIPGVRGRGYSTPKMGDAIWPGTNALMIIYCPEDGPASEIMAAIAVLQKRFPDEGLAAFCL